MTKDIEITICLGSSCYSRGNNKNLEIIQNYLTENDLEERTDFKGHLCEEVCKKGPALKINDTLYYGVTPDIVISILNTSLNIEEEE